MDPRRPPIRPRPLRGRMGGLTLAKMETPLAIRWSRPLPQGATPTTVTVSRDAAGRYFVSLLVEEEVAPFPSTRGWGGPGACDVVTLSTGEKTGNERFFRREEKRLARLQRRHAKKRKGSKNREKARRKVAKLHARIADRRRDFQHKLTTRLIHENQVVCVESLAVKKMLQNPPGQGHCRCGLGRNPPAVGVQGQLVWAHARSGLIGGIRPAKPVRRVAMCWRRSTWRSGRGRARSVGHATTGIPMPLRRS